MDAVTGRSIGTDRPPSPASFVVPTREQSRSTETNDAARSESAAPRNEPHSDAGAPADPAANEVAASDVPAADLARFAEPSAEADAATIPPTLATLVQTSSQNVTEMLTKLPAGSVLNAAPSLAQAQLGSIVAAPTLDASRVAMRAPSDAARAPLEALAIAGGESIEDLDEAAITELTADRRESRAPEAAVDRPPSTRASNESQFAEPARETTHAPRVHDTDRAAEILKQIRLRFSPEMRQATIHLAPPELGRLSIQLTIEDRRLSAAMRIEKRETLEVLGRHLPELRAALASHGIEAEQFELALGFQNDPNAHTNGRDDENAPPPSAISRPDARSVHDETLTRALAPLASASGVDLYA